MTAGWSTYCPSSLGCFCGEISKVRKPIQSRQGLDANMRPRRTPNTDRGTSVLRGDDGRCRGDDGCRDHDGRCHGHDVPDRYHAHDRDDRVRQQTQLLETARQQLSRKPEQTYGASGGPRSC